MLRAAPGVADVSVTATGPDDSDDRGLTVEYVPADAERPTRLWSYALGADPDGDALPSTDSAGHFDAWYAY